MTFLDWVSQNCLRFFIMAVSCSIVYLLMLRAMKIPRAPEAKHPATLFSLDQIMSDTYFRIFCFLFAGSVALVYAALAFSGGSLISVVKDALASRIASSESSFSSSDVKKIFDAAPPWFDPLLILMIFILFFSTGLNRIIVIVRDLLSDGSGIYAFVEEKAKSTARDLLQKNANDYKQSSTEVERILGETPLPAFYAGQFDTNRLTFQLIWVSIDNIKKFGPTDGINAIRERLDLGRAAGDPGHINAVHLAASGFLFLVLMIFYIIIIPMLGAPAKHFGVAWPDPSSSGWSTLVLFILCNTLTVVVPLIIGLGMYPLRRKAYHNKESSLATLLVVAATQWLVAFSVQEMFNVIDVSFASTHGMESYTISLVRIHISAFMYSLAPIIAFSLLIILGPRLSVFGILAALTSIAIGLDFFLCDAVYEYYCPERRLLFWHQAILGLWIMFSFFVAASANWRLRSITNTQWGNQNAI